LALKLHQQQNGTGWENKIIKISFLKFDIFEKKNIYLESRDDESKADIFCSPAVRFVL